MITFENVEQFRQPDPLGRPHNKGDDYGYFIIPSSYDHKPIVVVANGEAGGWEHVSASRRDRTPRWSEMCYLKNLFWPSNDVVVQYHPAEKDYVNNANNCLHLWRYCHGEIPTPPSSMVGIKELGTL